MTMKDRSAAPRIMYVCQCCWQHDDELFRRVTDGYLPIPPRRFNAEWRKLQRRLAKLAP